MILLTCTCTSQIKEWTWPADFSRHSCVGQEQLGEIIQAIQCAIPAYIWSQVPFSKLKANQSVLCQPTSCTSWERNVSRLWGPSLVSYYKVERALTANHTLVFLCQKVLKFHKDSQNHVERCLFEIKLLNSDPALAFSNIWSMIAYTCLM